MLSQNIDDNTLFETGQYISQGKVFDRGSRKVAKHSIPKEKMPTPDPKTALCPVSVHTLCDHASAGKLCARQQLVGKREHRAIEGEPARALAPSAFQSHCNKQSMC